MQLLSCYVQIIELPLQARVYMTYTPAHLWFEQLATSDRTCVLCMVASLIFDGSTVP